MIGQNESGRGQCRNVSVNRGEDLQKLLMPLRQICEVRSHKVDISKTLPAACRRNHLIGQIYGFTTLLNAHIPLHGWRPWCLYEEAIVHLLPQMLRDRSEYKPPSGSLMGAPKHVLERGDGEQRDHPDLHERLVKRRRHSVPGCSFQFYCYWGWNVAENLSIYEISHADNFGDCFMQPGLNHNRRVRTLLLLLISPRLVSGSRTDIWCFQLLLGAAWLVNLSEPLMPTELTEAQLMDCGGLI